MMFAFCFGWMRGLRVRDGKISRRGLIKAGIGAATMTGLGVAETAETLETQNLDFSAGKDREAVVDGPIFAKRPIEYVNVLFGTASLDDPSRIGNAPPPGEELYTGMTTPGAALPHGIDISPVNKDISMSYPHGNLYSYAYPRRTMVGFSSMVTDMLLMPLVGDWTTPPDRIRYASSYSKESERSLPGHYTVCLQDHKITVDLTATALTGLYRFTFPQTERATILLDLGPAASSNIEIVGDRVVRGRADEGKVFFIAEFSKSFKSFGTFHRNPPAEGTVGYGWSLLGMDVVTPDGRSETGTFTGCYLNYGTSEGETILAKIAAGVSFEQAQKRLEAENPAWDFQAIKEVARETWDRKLNAIEVKGGTEKERTIFYSAFYHAFASPTMVARKGEHFIAENAKNKQSQLAEYDRYGYVPYWDTGRNQVVLLTLLDPELKLKILRSQLDLARESGWMGTSFHGDHAVAMYLGDWERGISFDYEAAYEYLRKNANDTDGPRANLAEYLKRGWIHDIVVDHPSPPYDEGNAGVSKTLEYCYDDYCLAAYATKLGKEEDYRMFLARARNYNNLWDASTRFMRGRKEDGSWIAPFYPDEPYYNFMYKESNAWQTTWFVPQDVQGLISLMGGREAFVKRLDEFFTIPYQPKGIARDVTGMIGQYCHGNEPDHHVPYLYNWAGAPWKTQEMVRKIMRLMYGSDKDGLGLAGMDDQGESCSWYLMNAMGFYTVDPARAEYIIGSPIFDEVTIHMGNGKDFVIVAENNSENNVYIQAARLNGEPLSQAWFRHAAIKNGGNLVLTMGSAPNKNWGCRPEAAPPSMSG
jgi:predicted alpha-1,2-mannosidase